MPAPDATDPSARAERQRRPVALVTGASSGIGAALAEVIAADGYDLVLVARREAPLGALAERLATHAEVLALDLAERGAGDRLEAVLAERGIAVDVLVNNAGIGAMGRFADLDRERQLEMIDVNIRALADLTHRFVQPMRARRRGGIVNLASVASFLPGPGMAVYHATKAFVLSFSEALTAELGGSGITVTAICPGPTGTEFQERAGMTRSRLVSTMRMMSAEDVARIGWRGFRRGRRVVVTGLPNKAARLGIALAPKPLLLLVVKALQSERRGA